MFLNILGVTLLVKIVVSQQTSPCPAVLSYEPRNLEDDRWYGNLFLDPEEDLTGIYINIVLDRPAQLLGNWFGEITSYDNKEFLIHDGQYKVRAKEPVKVRFFVKFSRAQTIPSVSVVRFNGKTVCDRKNTSISEAIDRVETSGIVIKPTTTNRPYEDRRTTSQINLKPGVQDSNTLSNNGDDSDFFHGDFIETINASQDRNRPSSGQNASETNESCGVVNTEATPFISKGVDTRPGQWPWHTSLYHSKGIQLQYICGGTLITKQHIVTAAHCVTKPSIETVINKKNLLAYLGKYKLISFGKEVQDRDVDKIIVHPEYNATSYFNDIAILKLSRPVEITNYVRPCCLWEDDPEVESVENKVGTVVGWGFDENKKLSNKLMQAQMPVVPTIKCIYSNREFFLKYTFEKNFCAGYRNGTSVCNGDSGGGLVFPKQSANSQNTVWQLRGLVSIGVALQTGQGTCDTSQFIIFTDIAKHLSWIRQVISF